MYCVIIIKYSVFNDLGWSSSVGNTRYTIKESFILSVYFRPRCKVSLQTQKCNHHPGSAKRYTFKSNRNILPINALSKNFTLYIRKIENTVGISIK